MIGDRKSSSCFDWSDVVACVADSCNGCQRQRDACLQFSDDPTNPVRVGLTNSVRVGAC